MLKNIRLLIFLVNHWSSSVKSTNLHRNAYGAIGYIRSEGASLSLSEPEASNKVNWAARGLFVRHRQLFQKLEYLGSDLLG